MRVDVADEQAVAGEIDIPEQRKLFYVRLRHILARAGLTALFCLLAIGGAVLSVCTLGRSLYRWHGFAIELRLLPSAQGQTRLELTPLGEVRANTHLAPVALVASLREIQIDQIRKLLTANPNRDLLAVDFERSARSDLHNFILRQLVMAALGGTMAPFLYRSRRLRLYLGSSLLGTLAVAAVLGNAFTTFNGKAFDAPTYTGALRQAPWVIQFSKDAFTKIEALSQKLRTVALNLSTLYGRIERLSDTSIDARDADTFRVLHVSDIHNNVAALDFIHEVADDFKVNLIVDTGDLTDFGSPPETTIVHGIERLPYPYVFVAGNHDSRAVTDALARTHNVTVLNGDVVTVDGLTILGLPNPASVRAGMGSVDTTPEELTAGGEQLLNTVRALHTPPDIVAVHDPKESVPLWGHTPLILCGHMHRYYVAAQTASPADASVPSLPGPLYRTILCNAGTTGAAGLRYFEKEKGVPFSCAVLTFRRPPKAPVGGQETPPARPQLISIDLIALDGTLGQYSLSHYRPDAIEIGP